MKNIGKPCTGKPYARFDEGALRRGGMTPEHVVAACGEASPQGPATTTARISALLYPKMCDISRPDTKDLQRCVLMIPKESIFFILSP